MKRVAPLFYTIALAGVILCESAVLAPASAIVVSPFLITPRTVSCTGSVNNVGTCNITCASAKSQLRVICADPSGLSAEDCADVGSTWRYNQATFQCIPPSP
jgi:hypothetical protein